MSTVSPPLRPIEATILDLEGDLAFVSTLNPAAAEFTPSYYHIEDASDEARRVDDILKMVHHLVGVADSEQLSYAAAFADAEFDIDHHTAAYLDHTDALVGGLHTRPAQPKGNTYGRKRSGRGSRMSREQRRA